MRKPEKKDIIGAIIYSVVVVIFILLIGFLPTYVQNALKSDLFYVGSHGVNWWELSHFAYYSVLGTLLPGNFWVFTGVGVLFELLENKIGEADTFHDTKRAMKLNTKSEEYWYGQWQDLCFNSAGYLIGEYSRTGSLDLSFP